jgi:hypothetical protein
VPQHPVPAQQRWPLGESQASWFAGQEQLPPEQVAPVMHAMAQPPQWSALVWGSMQIPLQSRCGERHAQIPLEQVSPEAHAFRQLPQLAGSVSGATHCAPGPVQEVLPRSHVQPPPLQLPRPQDTSQLPQYEGLVARSTQVPGAAPHRL